MKEDDKDLIDRASEVASKKLPDKPDEILAALEEASDLCRQLEERRMQYHEQIMKRLEILLSR